MNIYLDHNATSLIDPLVLEVVTKAHLELFANPSSTHALGRKSKSAYLRAKDMFASFFKVSSSDIFFLSSATEAINWVLKTGSYKHIITSDLEHAATYNTLKMLEKTGTQVTFLHPGQDGVITKASLEASITPMTDLIFIGLANSETGLIQPTCELSKLAKTKGIPFYVDAVGILGKALFEIDPLLDGYVISSHKIHGPKGIAALITKRSKQLDALTYGGNQENGKKAGTENVPAALGFAQAFKILTDHPTDFLEIENKRNYFESKLQEALDIEIIGKDMLRTCNTSCIRFIDVSGETLLQLLDHRGIYASHGSACSSGALEPSRVLTHMDLPLSEVKQYLRFSLSKYTTKEELDQAIKVLITLNHELKELVNS